LKLCVTKFQVYFHQNIKAEWEMKITSDSSRLSHKN